MFSPQKFGYQRAAEVRPWQAQVSWMNRSASIAVNINAPRGLAPPRLRPRLQAIRPPAPHAVAPLEPQAQQPLV